MAERKYYGMYQGIVTRVNDPEKRGRIRVKCPTVLGRSAESAWCDPVVPVAYDNGGDFCIPLKGETVWIQFIEGNANKPVYLGGWWRREMTPLGSNYSNFDKVRTINYADCTIILQNDKITINVGEGSGNLIVEKNKITINGDLKVNGEIVANNIESNGISLTEHTHAVSYDSSSTGRPQ